MEANRPYIKIVSPLEDALTEDPLQAMYCGSVARMVQLNSGWLKRLLAMNSPLCAPNMTTATSAFWIFLPVIAPKGTPSGDWQRSMTISPDQIMAIGDNYNDLEMLDTQEFLLLWPMPMQV